MLEATQHENNSFVTLTYDDSNLNSKLRWFDGFPSLEPTEHRLWLDRLRKKIGYSQVRFFLVGEYGDESERPHYHCALFGFPTCHRGRTYRRPGHSRPLWEKCCPSCRVIGETWGRGDVDLGILETSSAQYVAGYVTKKMTDRNDDRLFGRYPEYMRSSRVPFGIGVGFMHEVADRLMNFNLDTSQSDVPVTLRHGSRELPLGRLMRMKLRQYIGGDGKAPPDAIKKMEAELRPLLLAARSSKTEPSLRAQIQKASAGKVARFESRQRLFKGRKTI